MKLSELFEDSERQELEFQMAWANRMSSIPPELRSKVHSLARNQMTRGESPSDAISNALDTVKAQTAGDSGSRKSKFTPMEPKKAKPLTKGTTQSGWSDKTHGHLRGTGDSNIRTALSKSNPKAIAKKAVDKVDKKVADLLDIDKAFSTRKDK